MKIFKKKHIGFTLIELIVTISVLSIVIVAVTQFFQFNLSTYSRGEKLAQVQFDVRMSSDFIFNELKNASAISSTLVLDEDKIDLNLIKSKFPSVTSVTFAIITESSRWFVQYKIEGNSLKGDAYYTVESKVLLNNDKLFYQTLSAVNGLTEIYYKN